MGKETVNHVQEVQRVPGRINPRRNTPRHIVIKLVKIKDKNIKSNKGKMTNSTRELPSGYQLISQQKLYNPVGNGMIYFKVMREEPATKNILPSKTLVQI